MSPHWLLADVGQGATWGWALLVWRQQEGMRVTAAASVAAGIGASLSKDGGKNLQNALEEQNG